jgi:hypothetical protein
MPVSLAFAVSPSGQHVPVFVPRAVGEGTEHA